MISKLILGTVQFGIDYGVSNAKGQTSRLEANEIARLLNKQGQFLMDTASEYGDAELILSEMLISGVESEVISKIPSIKGKSPKQVISIIHNTINLFGDGLWGLLFHSPEDILKKEYRAVLKEVNNLIASGDIKRIGGSIYEEKQIEILTDEFKLEILQLPFNVFDQRFMESKKVLECRSKGCEIHVRSAFLQGLLLMDYNEIPNHFNVIKPNFSKLSRLCSSYDISIYELCLKWVVQQEWVDRLIIGLNDLDQTRKLIDTFIKIKSLDDIELSDFSVTDLNIINPSRWP